VNLPTNTWTGDLGGNELFEYYLSILFEDVLKNQNQNMRDNSKALAVAVGSALVHMRYHPEQKHVNTEDNEEPGLTIHPDNAERVVLPKEVILRVFESAYEKAFDTLCKQLVTAYRVSRGKFGLVINGGSTRGSTLRKRVQEVVDDARDVYLRSKFGDDYPNHQEDHKAEVIWVCKMLDTHNQ
jgi:hypothetical protein